MVRIASSLLVLGVIAALIGGCGSSDSGGGHRRGHGKAASNQDRPQGTPDKRGDGGKQRDSAKPRDHRHHKPSNRHPKSSSGELIASRCNYRSPTSSHCGDIPPPGSCKLRAGGFLQDPRCTPGAIDPRVKQGNLDRTICRPGGYTDSVRPPTSYTTPLEFELISSYSLPIGPDRSELDHLISLQLGGAPADPRNLFPEPYKRGAYTKDTVEGQLHDAVCAGRISLRSAQLKIIAWVNELPPDALPSNPPPLGRKPKHKARHKHRAGKNAGRSGKRCDRNYSGACLNPNAFDYDCKGGDGDGPRYVQGPIQITGRDHFGLGTSGDKVACE